MCLGDTGLQVQALFSWYQEMCEYVFPEVTAGTRPGSYREAALIGSIGINARILESGRSRAPKMDEYSAACKLLGAISELCGGMTIDQWDAPLASVVRIYTEGGAIRELRGFGLEVDVVGVARKEVLWGLRDAHFLPWEVSAISETGRDVSHSELLAFWGKWAPACLVAIATYILCIAMASSDVSDSTLSCAYLRGVVNEPVELAGKGE